ncbi:Rap1-interacting factor 1 N terminal-domain-containing protein [Kalaharituber pfeilii]|nr:Rap1-interacting factor 1 N terminal-domain-containing protein [Kalaharituber pfeilii]
MVEAVPTTAQSQTSASPVAGGKFAAKLQNRPPTPPRESARAPGTPQDLPADPPSDGVLETPTPSVDSAGRRKKKVNWSPWTKYHKPDDPLLLQPRKTDPSLTPLKSILKPFNPSIIPIGLLNSTDQSIKAYSYDSFPAMLESITQALASTERSKKLDTYVTFCNTLKAYDDKPDLKAIKNKLPVLLSFIRRDLGAKLPNSANNSSDSQLIQQAIKLLTCFAWLSQLAEAIDDDDAIFFVQHAVQVIKDPQSPKILVTYFLNFLAQQWFPGRIITAERVTAIINALNNIEERTGGNTVIVERISIYHKLLLQAKQVMAARTPDWMENVIGAVLGSNRELRSRAIGCMTEAARAIGTEKVVFRSISSLFNREDGDGVKMIQRVTERLSQFIRNGDGVHAAQVWGLIVLLLRARHPISSWEHFNAWLNVIQQCFNSSTIAIKIAANTNWSRLIYVLHCGPEVTTKNMDLLTRPLMRYLDPQNASANSKGPRQAALSNVCALLYYNFRPNAPIKHLSQTWESVVVALVEKLVLYGKHEVEDGCRILAALFDGSHQKPWNELRGLEKEAIKAEEIIRLDPKWVRCNSAQVIKTLEVAIRRSSWEGDDCAIRLLWRKFTKTLADASMKEVKVSSETMDTVAHIFNMLQRFWREGPTCFVNALEKSSDGLIDKITFLVMATFEAIGTFCFTEKQLSYDDQNEFIAISTPSNRYSSGGSFAAVFHPPIVHLFQLFLNPFEGAELTDKYFNSANSILAKCLEAQDSRRKRLSLLSACSTVLPQRGATKVHKQAWSIVAKLTEAALPVKEKVQLSPTPVAWEFKDVQKILQWGCGHNLTAWSPLFEAFAHTVLLEQGELELISTVIEPLADTLRLEKLDPDSWLVHGRKLLEKAVYPKSTVPTESTSRVSYGHSVQPRRNLNTEPYDNLYSMINQFLVTSYQMSDDKNATTAVKRFVTAVVEFIRRCPRGSVLKLLKMIQDGVAIWMADQKNILVIRESELVNEVHSLWAGITEAIRQLPRYDSYVLQYLTTLIASGLESRRKSIVNNTIKTWNTTFGAQKSLEYPSRVRIVMKKLRPVADINLPTFPEDIEEIVPTPPVWEESQESQDFLAQDPVLWSTPTPVLSRRRDRTTSPMINPISSSRSFIDRLREVSTKSPQAQARLKHMDSQLVFEPIEPEASQVIAVDSQLLTEHQKEVRDRQHEETAMLFRDINLEKSYRGQLATYGQRDEAVTPDGAPPVPSVERSPSVEEFVDAPEENPDNNVAESGVEVEFVPSTAFVVQVPARRKSPVDSNNGHGALEATREPVMTEQISDKQHSGQSKRPLVDASTSTGPELNCIERADSTTPNGVNESAPGAADDSPMLEALPATEGGKEHNSRQDNSGNTDLGRISSSPVFESEVLSNEDQAPESVRQQENSIVEVPDSFIFDNEDADVDMFGNSQDQGEQEVAEPQIVESSESKQLESLDSEGAQNKEYAEAENDEDSTDVQAPEPKSAKIGRKASHIGGTKKRKSLAVRTSTKSRPQPSEPMLDCIMVSGIPVTPTKTPIFETAAQSPSVRKHAESSDIAMVSSPGTSTLNSRKRKQKNDQSASVSAKAEKELNPADHPPKRRATRSGKSTPNPSRDIARQTKSPVKPPQIATAKTQIPQTAANMGPLTPRHSRVTRRRAALDESIVLDSQPDVIGTEMQNDDSETHIPPSERKEISFISDTSMNSQSQESLHEEPLKTERQENPLSRFKEALEALEAANLEPNELREAEDAVFDVYVRLRGKRRKI